MANISIGAIIEKEQEEFEKKLKLRIIASEAFYQHQEKKKAERQKQALEKEISKVNNVIHALKEIKLALNGSVAMEVIDGALDMLANGRPGHKKEAIKNTVIGGKTIKSNHPGATELGIAETIAAKLLGYLGLNITGFASEGLTKISYEQKKQQLIQDLEFNIASLESLVKQYS